MRIRTHSLIRHPIDRVYSTYRDRLPELAGYIPDVAEIRVASREMTEAGVKLHNVWVSNREIPSYARRIVKPEMLAWDDLADWRDADRVCDWTIQVRVFRESVDCRGQTVFTERDAGTEVRIEGDFHIDLRQIPGVPKLLAGGLAPRVEKFIVSLVTPNLERVNESLQRYLDDHP
jgi:hypothetical protein